LYCALATGTTFVIPKSLSESGVCHPFNWGSQFVVTKVLPAATELRSVDDDGKFWDSENPRDIDPYIYHAKGEWVTITPTPPPISSLYEKPAAQVPDEAPQRIAQATPFTAADELPDKCRAAYQSVSLLMIQYNCQEWANVAEAGHKAQVRIGKQKDTLGCIPTATDKIKDEMKHVAETAERMKFPPMELWCIGAIGMFHDTPEHSSWIKVLK
jgi:hypothetical protein